MGRITIVTSKELVEGIIASLFYPILVFKISQKHQITIKNIKWTIVLPWFLTWIVRKMTMHMFDYFTENYGLENREYKFNFYFF